MFRKKGRNNSETITIPTLTGNTVSIPRCRSVPIFSQSKGILKFVTEDESIHCKYGDKKDDSSNDRGNIRFDVIQIREYARTVGDNPSCSSGPPVAISWEYDPDTKVLSIDEYEESRPARRSHIEMVLPRSIRERMLKKEWDIPQRLIAEAVRNNVKIKNQRRQTVNNLGKLNGEVLEETLERAGKKLMRGLMLKKSTAQQVAELERQFEIAQVARKEAELQMLLHRNETHEKETSSANSEDEYAPESTVVAATYTGMDINGAHVLDDSIITTSAIVQSINSTLGGDTSVEKNDPVHHKREAIEC